MPCGEAELGFISPVVRRIAAEYAIDLHAVQGTGEGGRITKKDVLAYIEARQAGLTRRSVPTLCHNERWTPAAASAAIPPQQQRGFPPQRQRGFTGEIIRLTPVRRLIAEHMVMSKHTSPHVTTVMEADLSRVVAHRGANKAAFERDGANLTFTAYFAAAAVQALKAYPLVNSSWTEAGHPAAPAGQPGHGDLAGRGGADRAGDPAGGDALAAGAGAGDQRSRNASASEKAAAGRGEGRHVHHHQPRHNRLAVRHAGHQPAAVRHPGRGRHPEAGGGDQRRSVGRRDRHPTDGLPVADFRSPHTGWGGGGSLPGEGGRIVGKLGQSQEIS